jgi:uncharacterized hydantoinase/oxoprolinase family protein
MAVRHETGTLFASAARTATVNSADKWNHSHRGIRLIIDVTAVTATPSVVFTLQGKNTLPGSADYYTVLASAAVTATGETVMTVYPGITVAANVSASTVLPPLWRVNAAHGDADSITYSCRYELIP